MYTFHCTYTYDTGTISRIPPRRGFYIISLVYGPNLFNRGVKNTLKFAQNLTPKRAHSPPTRPLPICSRSRSSSPATTPIALYITCCTVCPVRLLMVLRKSAFLWALDHQHFSNLAGTSAGPRPQPMILLGVRLSWPRVVLAPIRTCCLD